VPADEPINRERHVARQQARDVGHALVDLPFQLRRVHAGHTPHALDLLQLRCQRDLARLLDAQPVLISSVGSELSVSASSSLSIFRCTSTSSRSIS
jgi:hypothetical protein